MDHSKPMPPTPPRPHILAGRSQAGDCPRAACQSALPDAQTSTRLLPSARIELKVLQYPQSLVHSESSQRSHPFIAPHVH
eukprot:3658096-Amphidinium_carterae.1